MERRAALALLAACAACSRHEAAIEVFPTSVAGWHRTAIREIPVSSAPDPIPQSVVRRIQQASYEGGGRIEARAYQLTRQEIGLDLAQKWQPSADTVFFWAREYFILVEWQPETDRKALHEFTRSLEKRLNAQ
jgi:hypothetical protein